MRKSGVWRCLILTAFFVAEISSYANEIVPPPNWSLLKGLRRIIKSSKPLEQQVVKGVSPLTESQIKQAVNAAILTNAAKDPNLAEMAASGLIEKNNISVPDVKKEIYAFSTTAQAAAPKDPAVIKPKTKIVPVDIAQEKVTQEKYKLWEKYGEATLLRAAQEGMLYSVQFMVSQGAEITDDIIFAARDSKNKDLLKYIIGIKGSTRATLQAVWNYPDLLAELLSQPTFIDDKLFLPDMSGMPVTTKDQRGTLLYFAASYAHPKSVELLCSFFKPVKEISDLMLSRALFDPLPDRLEVALMLIEQFGADAAPAISYISGKALYTWISPLKELGADVNFVDKRGNTPLHNAVDGIPYKRNREDYIKTVEVLLQSGAKPSSTNAEGKTPLDMMKERLEKMDTLFYSEEWKNAMRRTIRLLESVPHK